MAAGTVATMSDERGPTERDFDWLYSDRPGSADSDPEATQAMRRPPVGGSRPYYTPPAEDQPEPTRVLGVQHPLVLDDSAPPPQSFGGTYASPRQPGPRFATPAPPESSAPYGLPPTSQLPPGGSTLRRPTPGRPKRRNWWVRGILLLFLAWLLFLVAVPMWAWSKLAQVDAEPDGNRPADTPGATYLLVGSDSREGMTAEEEADLGTGAAEGERTDTILLLHVPDGDGPKLLLSVPRDSFVEIPGHEQNKINAAYAFGGPDLLVQTVEQATDVRIDSYLEVGFGGFVEIVDAVGGIEVCPTEAIDDPKAGGLRLDKGCTDVDGREALGYSRSRAFELGDITRALHQREVITAVGQRAASWQTVALPWRYFRVNSAAADTVRVGEDVGPVDLAKFAWAMARPGSDAKRCVVPYTTLGQQTAAGSVVIWDDDKAGAIFAAIREDDTGSISCQPQ